jgi:hypothetical protein
MTPPRSDDSEVVMPRRISASASLGAAFSWPFWLAIAAIVATMLVYAIVLRGPWFDEFCTLRISQASVPLATLFRDRWLPDTHPILFNAWATLIGRLGITSVIGGRMASNLPALAILLAIMMRFGRRAPEDRAFYFTFILLVLSMPWTITAFGNFRSVFWQIAGMAIMVQAARFIATTDHDLDTALEPDIAGIAVIGVFAAIALHFASGLAGVAVVAAVLAVAWARGLRKWTLLLFSTGLLACGFMVGSAWVQIGYWQGDIADPWIRTGAFAGILAIAGRIAIAFVHVPVPLVAGARYIGATIKEQRAFLSMMAGGIMLAAILLMIVNAMQPIIVPRYLVGLTVPVVAIVAALGGRSAARRRWFAATAIIAAAVGILTVAVRGQDGQWRDNAKRIAAIVGKCPSTAVYGMSGWLIDGDLHDRAAPPSQAIYAIGYGDLARSLGFQMTLINGSTPLRRSAVCPTLLWVEHRPVAANFDPVSAFRNAGFPAAPRQKLSLIRSASGFIVMSQPQ